MGAEIGKNEMNNINMRKFGGKTNWYQVACAGKAAFNLHKFVLAMWGVTSKSKHILEAIGLDGLESMVYLLNRHVGAGEVHHGLHTDNVLHLVGNFQS